MSNPNMAGRGGNPAGPGNPGQQAGKKVSLPVDQAIAQALKLFNAGRVDQARQICGQIVQARPQIPDAQNLMGAILNTKGDKKGAAEFIRRAAQLAPRNAQFQSNLGEIERQLGNLDDALAALERSIALNPKAPQTLNNLGILLYDRREFAEAEERYREAIALKEDYAEAHNNLGNALRAQRKPDEALAEYEKALLLRESYPEAYNNMASVLRDQDQIPEAEHAYRKAISLKPTYLEAYNNLATMYVQLDRSDEALKVLGEALEIDDKHVPTLVQVARTQLSKANHVQAEQAARLALKQDPQSAIAHCVLGEVLHETDRYFDALEAFERALAIKPDLSEAHNHYGICLKSVGRLDDAKKEFLKTIEISPYAYGCYANLADMEKFTPDNEHFLAMKKIIDEAKDPNTGLYMGLHFALGKAYDDIGEHETAMQHYKTGTSLKRAQLNYDESESQKFFDDIRAVFSEEFMANPPYPGHESERPVFIVGMPRSGSTLAEQVLSSHPEVFGAGEIKEFSRQLGAMRGRFPAIPKYPAMGAKMSRAQYQIVAEGYDQVLRKLAPDATRVTDKLLTNFYFVGMLHILFPKAKFLHTKRNPVDTCISAYTKLFKDDMPHSYDFGELGRYYLKYVELMQHWDKVLPPGVLMTVNYEDTVADLEGTARRIVDFVGLPWDPVCLAFHESARPVKTASVVQVRQPVYKTSVERFRRYGPAVQPLIDALGYEPQPVESPS